MSGFMKKLMATGAALTIGISSVAFANNNGCCPPPACDPCAGWCDNFSFNAAWLYWKTSGDELDYAVDKISHGDSDGPFTDYEKIHDVKGDWSDGFRVGFGFDVPCAGWGVDVNWTHYESTSSSHLFVHGPLASTSTDVVSVAFPVIDGFSTDLGFDDEARFKGKLNFQYNVVDVELGKWLCCGNSAVLFRPHIGFRFADIQEKFTDEVELKGTTVSLNGLTGIAASRFHNKNDFKGWGVRAGLDTDLRLCDGWSLIGRGAMSAIWGRTHLRNHVFFSDATVTDLKASEIKEDYRQVRFITDLSFGIRYKTLACCCYPITFELSWEHHYLFGQHRFWVDDVAGSRTLATTSWKKNGDLALQGLTLSVGVDF